MAFRSRTAGRGVLIETYWNVNYSKQKVYIHAFRINRNILECKCGNDDEILSCFHVLIETYWNVNALRWIEISKSTEY